MNLLATVTNSMATMPSQDKWASIFDDGLASWRRPNSGGKVWVETPLIPFEGDHDIICKGWLLKRRDVFSFMMIQRYYELRPNALVCYQDESKGSLLSVSYMVPQSHLELIPAPTKELPQGFRLTRNGQSIELFPPDAQAASDWLRALRRLCIQRNFRENYHLLRVLGRGPISRIFLARHRKTGAEVAVKVITKERLDKKKHGVDTLVNEVTTLGELEHPNIVHLHEVYEDDASITLVMDHAGPNLLDFLSHRRDLSEADVKAIIIGILSALEYIHKRKLMHRDINPHNIFVRDDGRRLPEVKLGEFGLATRRGAERELFLRCGRPGYIAPEVFVATNGYDVVCDIFSTGIVAYLMLTGVHPFDTSDTHETFCKNRDTKPSFEAKELEMVGIKGISLLKALLEPNPTKRLTAEVASKHTFFDQFSGDMTPSPIQRRSLFTNLMKLRLKITDVSRLKRTTFDRKAKNEDQKDTGSFFAHFDDVFFKREMLIMKEESIDSESMMTSSALMRNSSSTKVNFRGVSSIPDEDAGSPSRRAVFSLRSTGQGIDRRSPERDDLYRRVLKNRSIAQHGEEFRLLALPVSVSPNSESPRGPQPPLSAGHEDKKYQVNLFLMENEDDLDEYPDLAYKFSRLSEGTRSLLSLIPTVKRADVVSEVKTTPLP